MAGPTFGLPWLLMEVDVEVDVELETCWDCNLPPPMDGKLDVHCVQQCNTPVNCASLAEKKFLGSS